MPAPTLVQRELLVKAFQELSQRCPTAHPERLCIRLTARLPQRRQWHQWRSARDATCFAIATYWTHFVTLGKSEVSNQLSELASVVAPPTLTLRSLQVLQPAVLFLYVRLGGIFLLT